jgi:endonuclease YncB( thermonuclease family)
VSRHWKPESTIVRGPWTRQNGYVRAPAARLVWAKALTLLLGAACLGFAYGYYQAPAPRGVVDTSAIEWNAVQAVPTRTPDAEEVEWERRAADGSVIASDSDAIQEPGLPRRSAARNDVVQGAGRDIYVIDGDTFVMAGQRVRIAGIDAPETHPPRCLQEAQLGLAATAKLRELLNSGTMTISGTTHDRYGRDVRRVTVDGHDVSEAMIGAGLARSYDGGKRQPWC